MTMDRWKVDKLLLCFIAGSTARLASFERLGLNKLLDGLVEFLAVRYALKITFDVDLDSPDDKQFSALLHRAAMEMEPLCITPTGLRSPTNNSKPAEDSGGREPAGIGDSGIDFYPTPWASSPELSTRVQQGRIINVSSPVLYPLDGSETCKRRHKQEREEEIGETLGKCVFKILK